MDYSLRSLRYFVATADKGSVTAAALQLCVSQPSVSAAIAHLESAFGQRLFIRKPASGVMLTPAGERLLPHARSLLFHADEFGTIARSLDADFSGRIRMACFTNLAPVHLAALLRTFQADYPNIDVDFFERDQADILDGLRNARYEFALTFDLCELAEFDVTVLADIAPHVVLHAGHPLANQQAVSLRALAPEPLIMMDIPYSREYLLGMFDELGVRARLKYLPNSFEMVRSLAGNGLGYGLLNLVPLTRTTYDGSPVVSLPLQESFRRLKVVLVRLPNMPRRRIATAFYSTAQRYFAQRYPGMQTSGAVTARCDRHPQTGSAPS